MKGRLYTKLLVDSAKSLVDAYLNEFGNLMIWDLKKLRRRGRARANPSPTNQHGLRSSNVKHQECTAASSCTKGSRWVFRVSILCLSWPFKGKRPQCIKKQQAVRKSLRLQAIRQSHQQCLSKSNHIQEVQKPQFPPASNIPKGRKIFALVAFFTMS